MRKRPTTVAGRQAAARAGSRAVLARARARAQDLGQIHYEGKVCPRGHSGLRYTISMACVECAKEDTHNRRNTERPRVLWQAARRRAAGAGLEFTVELEDVTIPERCPVLGIPLTLDGDRITTPSLDRVDNTKGYVKGNVRVISTRANLLKRDSTLDEMRALVAYMEQHLIQD